MHGLLANVALAFEDRQHGFDLLDLGFGFVALGLLLADLAVKTGKLGSCSAACASIWRRAFSASNASASAGEVEKGKAKPFAYSTTSSNYDLRAASEEERAYLESLIREDFERCHPGETLEDLKRRASFSKEDKGLLRDWMAIAAGRAAADQAKGPQLNSAA
jgi:hypothetical protein